MPYIENLSEAVARHLQPLRIGVVHKPEATIRRLVMRPKAPLSRGETANVVYRVQCGSCEANYVGETGKRLQTRMIKHARAVRRMDQLSFVAEHCAASGHTFSFPGRRNPKLSYRPNSQRQARSLTHRTFFH
ncbi:unnamed protein product [Schistocephalus solidus]|uniref:GIY-YIG domain-containing protein n=1 Tax=Schistocephalus solidus TaxID=70667 RepID=A0A183TIN0_SCHSO|nr:unnamed protein product [Schistocephalus solidus]